MKTSPPRIPSALFLLVALAFHASAAVSDFTRTATPNWNCREGVTHVTYAKSASARAWIFKFDLAKGYRLRAWLGDTGANGANRATLGEMAEAMSSAGAVPVAGINGDYFRTDSDIARPTGLTIAESRVAHGGWNVGNSTDYCYIAALADGNLYHGKLDCAAGYGGGNPAFSWQVNALGRKVRNAIRTNYQNYPVRAGAINPVGGGNSDDGYVFSTTIGNYQSRNYYWRTLVGIGTNAVGVATNLVLFTSQASAAFPDVDAYRMMIDEGCSEVGELDGGGSAQMWAESGADAVFIGSTTAHGGYVMNPRDTNPIRALANGLFVLPPRSAPDPVAIGSGTYPTLDEALCAVAPGETIDLIGTAPLAADAAFPTNCTLRSAAADPRSVAVSVASPAALADAAGSVAASVTLRNVAFRAGDLYLAPPSGTTLADALASGDWRRWCALGGLVGAAGHDFTNGTVRVTFAECDAATATAGYALELTLRTLSGGVVARTSLALSGAGAYDFALSPLSPGTVYLYEATLVEPATGAAVEGSPVASGTFVASGDGTWFRADASHSSGGAWVGSAPPVVDGAFAMTNAAPPSGGVAAEVPYAFAAMQRKDGTVKAEAVVDVAGGPVEEARFRQRVAAVAADPPAGMLAIVEQEDGAVAWWGLSGPAVSATPLHGHTPDPGRPYRYIVEISGVAGERKVSYLVQETGDGAAAPVRLCDASGTYWLPSPATGSTAGQMEFLGQGRVASLAGAVLAGDVAEVAGVGYPTLASALAAAGTTGSVRLLGDATLDADDLPPATYGALDPNGFDLVIYDGTNTATFDPETGLIAILAPSKATVIMVF